MQYYNSIDTNLGTLTDLLDMLPVPEHIAVSKYLILQNKSVTTLMLFFHIYSEDLIKLNLKILK